MADSGLPRGSASLREAAAWSVVLTAGRVITNAAVLLVLAAILGPSTFGTIAIATIYVLALQVAFQQGLTPALISRRVVDDETLQVAFRLSLLIAVTLAAASWLVSDGLGEVFDDPDLPDAIRALTALLPLFALDLVPDAMARRVSDFKFLAFKTNVSALVGGVVGVVAAFMGLEIWSLVLQQVSTAVVSTALLLVRSSWKPRLRSPWPWSRMSVSRQLLHYSGRAGLAGTAQFLSGQVDSVLAGVFFSPRVVGMYRMSGRIVATVTEVAIRSGQMSLLPDFARRRTEAHGSAEARILEIQRVIALAGMPLFGVLAGVAFSFPSILGEEWEPAAYPLLLLSLAAVVETGLATIAPAVQAEGRPGSLAWVNGASLAGTVALVGVVGIVAADRALEIQLAMIASARLVVVAALTAPLSVWVLRRTLGVRTLAYLGAIVPGGLIASAAIIAGLTAHTWAAQHSVTPLLELLAAGASGGAATVGGYAIFWRTFLLSRMREAVKAVPKSSSRVE
ncbi:oligosaccharide flippase family protein [Geodermatophilus sp. DSM 44513]|uniref:oligosaccharide flippase family protein n=1 Tax=Geodermatophilus sp. DSM 44513 TaxID=1528104 RepID=UPI0012867DA4|nr:oligosaccharide flippase family protein [Geodermatophilus sp. DSM 44513]WNV76009.1 oligosaccharide flippase family protein [Geodermatophilus sp. DSM 44513]